MRTSPGQDTLLSLGAFTHALRLRQLKHASSPHVHIFKMREQMGITRENPFRHGENVQTPHKQWPQPRIDFFSHKQYNKITLNKMMLFKDLLYQCYINGNYVIIFQCACTYTYKSATHCQIFQKRIMIINMYKHIQGGKEGDGTNVDNCGIWKRTWDFWISLQVFQKKIILKKGNTDKTEFQRLKNPY